MISVLSAPPDPPNTGVLRARFTSKSWPCGTNCRCCNAPDRGEFGSQRRTAGSGVMKSRFWSGWRTVLVNGRDLERKLTDFQTYYNADRIHASVDGHRPSVAAVQHHGPCRVEPCAVGFLLPETWSSAQWRPDDEFETDRRWGRLTRRRSGHFSRRAWPAGRQSRTGC